MAETQITGSSLTEPDPSGSQTHQALASDCGVCESWQQVIQAVLGIVVLVIAVAMFHFYHPVAVQSIPQDDLQKDLQKQVHELTAEVEQLQQEQAMRAVGLNHYRNSIGYIYGIYQVGLPNRRPAIRARVSGTVFLVGPGLLAPNRRVAEPWYGDTEAEDLIRQGGRGTLESLVIFFPGSPLPVTLSPAAVSKSSDHSDALTGRTRGIGQRKHGKAAYGVVV